MMNRDDGYTHRNLRDGMVSNNMERLVPRTCPWADNPKKAAAPVDVYLV